MQRLAARNRRCCATTKRRNTVGAQRTQSLHRAVGIAYTPLVVPARRTEPCNNAERAYDGHSGWFITPIGPAASAGVGICADPWIAVVGRGAAMA